MRPTKGQKHDFLKRLDAIEDTMAELVDCLESAGLGEQASRLYRASVDVGQLALDHFTPRKEREAAERFVHEKVIPALAPLIAPDDSEGFLEQLYGLEDTRKQGTP